MNWRHLLIAALGVICVWASARADSTNLKEISIEYTHFIWTPRLLELPYQKPTNTLALNMDVNVFGSLYWNNKVGMISTNQPKWVGWEFEVGAHIPGLPMDAYYTHHSQHEMDGVHPFVDFPIQDELGVRVFIHRSP